MFRNISTAVIISLATAHGVSAQTAEETTAWDAVKTSQTSAEVIEFIERYPEGAFIPEAKALLIDLLWTELDGGSIAPAVTQAETPAEDFVAVTFTSPLTVGTSDVIGKSIEELIDGSPLFPPVEGLPDAFWKEQQCSNCHEWEQANLCTQANSYLSDAGGENLTKKHPYGGGFKLNLRNWAQGGCE